MTMVLWWQPAVGKRPQGIPSVRMRLHEFVHSLLTSFVVPVYFN